MIKFLVDRPIATCVFSFALFLLGIIAFLHLPISLLPNVDVPEITVKVITGNYSSREIESRITGPMRDGLNQLRGVENIESKSSEGKSVLFLRFEQGKDMSMSYIEVNEKIDQIMNRLPRDIDRPLVSKSSVNDIPVFYLDVFPKMGGDSIPSMALNSVYDVIRRRIEQIPEIAMADVTGYLSQEIVIEPKWSYLEALGVNENVFVNAIEENQINVGNITVKDGISEYYIQIGNDLLDLNQIQKLPIQLHGRIFNLGDIAAVKLKNIGDKGGYLHRDKSAVNYAVFKKTAAKIGAMRAAFEKSIIQIKSDYPEFEFVIHQDQTDLLNFSVANLQQDILLGGLCAILLMTLFIRKIKSSLLVTVTIPLALTFSQFGFYLLGISINIISLGGLILGLSMIIDNSIVVMDSIAGFRSDGKSYKEAAILGTTNVIGPLITSVLTNSVVFIPLIFLSGLAGYLFYDQALSIVIGVVASLLVAILILPCLYSLVNREKKDREIPVLVDVSGFYDRILTYCFKKPYFTMIFFVVLGASGILFYSQLEKERLPQINKSDFEMSIDWNNHLSVAENKKRSGEIIRVFDQFLSQSSTWFGEQKFVHRRFEDQGLSQTTFYFKTESPADASLLQNKLRLYLDKTYPEITFKFSSSRNAFDEVFGEHSSALRILVRNEQDHTIPDIETVSTLVKSLKRNIPKIDIDSVSSEYKAFLTIDNEKAALLGVSVNDISKSINSAVKNKQILDVQGQYGNIPIKIGYKEYGGLQTLLSTTVVTNDKNEKIPLTNFVTYQWGLDYKIINANGDGTYYPLDIQSNKPKELLDPIKTAIAKYKTGLNLTLEGSFFDNQKLINELFIIFLISIILLYFVLAAQFESLIQPLFILLELPIAVSGAFLFLYLGSSSLNLMSMIGLIVMNGLIINDSILKIDSINKFRKSGMELKSAIIAGGHLRIRSIVMISLTTLVSLSPTLFMNDLGSALQKPLVLALIGGMLIGLLVSLFLIPIIYWLVYSNIKTNETI